MPERAPGHDAPRDEPECYNCGVKGHFVIACPEEVRKVPAGMQAFRQRKAASQSKGSSQGGSAHGKGAGGMVITRYGPPPGHHSQLPKYPPPASLPPPPPPPASAPPSGPYFPPAGHAPIPPPPAAGWPYPPSSYGSGYPAPPPPPPPPPHPYPSYDAYGQPSSAYGPPPPSHPPGPPAAPYYPPYGAQPPTYYPPLQQPYGPPAPYASHGPPPVALGHPAHPSLPPIPPPPAYPNPPPPVPAYPPAPHESHQPYFSPAYPVASSRPPQHDRNRNQRHRQGDRHSDRHGAPHKGRDRERERPKDKDRDRDRGRISKQQRKGQAQRNKRVSTVAETAAMRPSTLPTVLPASLPARLPRRTPDTATPLAEGDEAAKVEQKEPSPEAEDDEFDWELEAAFAENHTKPADPVGRPLSTEYTDGPTIPPSFDAKSIKSDFFSADDCSAFSRSIRESKFWDKVKGDPAFVCWPGMVRCRFPGHPHEYSSYPTTSAGDRKETVVEEVILDEIVVKPQYSPRQEPEPSSLRRKETVAHGSLGKHSRNVVDGLDRNLKRFKGPDTPVSRPAFNSASSGPSRHRGDVEDGRPPEQRPARPRAYGSGRTDLVNSDLSSNVRGRHDSGYHSNNSPEKRHGGPRTSREAAYRSRSRSRSREHAKYGTHRESESPRGRNDQGLSPESPRSGSSSPLDDLEMEILGMVREKKVSQAEPKPKRRQIKVADAFSRRW